jgi:hypothetical protein
VRAVIGPPLDPPPWVRLFLQVAFLVWQWLYWRSLKRQGERLVEKFEPDRTG